MRRSRRITRLCTMPTCGTLVGALLLMSGTAGAEVVARQITDPADLLPGPAASGQLGDYLLANDVASFIISAPEHAHDGALSGGHILDAAPVGGADEFGNHLTFLGDSPRQAVYDDIAIFDDGVTPQIGIVVTGVDSQNPTIHITTRYTLVDGESHLTIKTEINNTGSEVPGYQAGDQFDWAEGVHFVPGYGFDVTGLSTITEWTASRGAATCYGCTELSGVFTVDHGADWSRATLLSADLPAGSTLAFVRTFVVGEPDLVSVTDVVHDIRGMTTGLLAVDVVDESTGAGIPHALVDCSLNEISPYTEALTDAAGTFTATLPQFNYGLATEPPGYYPGETNLFVIAGMTNTAELELMQVATSEGRGDTLTTVMRPILSVPAIATPGESFTIEAIAPQSTTDWTAELRHGGLTYDLSVWNVNYDHPHERWFMSASVPPDAPEAVFDLVVDASTIPADTVAHAVSVKSSIDSDFYFLHVTDTHLPTHMYHWQQGAEADTSEMEDLRAVIDDVNIINPAFVLHTGDLVNESELEDYLGWHVFSKAHRILREFDMPVFVVGGNHDLGGWDSTLPPDGTGRRDWWSIFGWRYLADPPPGDGIYTQNYSFDYAGAHFLGLEAYNNYDDWRYDIYGSDSFTNLQLSWMLDDLAATPMDMAKISFYHIDFQWQLDIGALGIDCSLWGHIHSNWGSETEYPYDLGTDSCCDDNSAFRLVRVSGNTVTPLETLYAGENGEEFTVDYVPANDGSSAVVSAVIDNGYPESFEHAVVKFHVPASAAPYATDNGTITQTLVDGDVATVTVAVPLPANATEYVGIAPATHMPDEPLTTLALSLTGANPTRSGTSLSFVLPSRADVRLAAYDLAGRRVAVLVEEVRDAGEHAVDWDLRDATGSAVASGVYFLRLEAGGDSAHEKLVVLR